MAITWFNAPAEGMSPGGEISFKTLNVTENGTYSEAGKAYSSVAVNVPLPTGKITITENGTDINIAQYAKADVNVAGGGGSSDFSTAEVTITCVTGDTTTKGKICLCAPNQIAVVNYGVPKNQTVTLTVPLYKGSCRWLTEQGEVTLVSGSATIDPENHYVTITGDCTLKIYVKQV